jgi:signal transduction histidine kinase
VSVPLARSITGGVERLQRGARRIQEGDLDHRVEVTSNDEIQDLAESFNDMAERLRQNIERLREANRELEKLDQTKADLVANVSHELKTPLTALRGYLELLQHGDLGALDERARKAVEVCQRNVLRLALRIEELVQLSQLEQREWEELTMETVSVDRILQTVVETLEPRYSERGIRCTLEIASGLPPMLASRDQLERVLLNLLDNASKFTDRGGSVEVSVARDDREGREGVLIRVADTGVGIAAAEQLRIFDRFYQVDPSVRRRHGGMGLGLSLVRAIVEAHRGVVWVESDLGRGATFSVWLPLRPYGDSGESKAVRRRAASARLRGGPGPGWGSS